MDDTPLIAHVHAHTPDVACIDGRRLPVRHVAYWRRDDGDGIAEPRVNVQQHDAPGRLVVQRDPRFQAQTSRPNLTTIYSLSGAVLRVDSVDAGWRLGLPGEAGQLQESWDGRDTHRQYEYDQQRRPTAVHEYNQAPDRRTTEYLLYAGSTAEATRRNQCGRLTRRDDTAGTLHLNEYGLLGALLVDERHFLKTLQRPDWPPLLEDRNELLERDNGFQTRRHYTPCGEQIWQVDARGHCQSWHFDRAGQLQQVRVRLKNDSTEQRLLHSLEYNAQGQVESQTAGNGTTTLSQFDPANARLQRLETLRRGRGRLQDLSYTYDAGGNIVEMQDHTQPTRFFANQEVSATNRYVYDSLSQLIRATGREALGQSNRPELPDLAPNPGDSSRLLNYTEHYDYDRGGNLLLLRHESDQPGQAHRRAFKVAEGSNRALPWDEQQPPDFNHAFDANGNLQRLHPHDQHLRWTGQNQLQQITQVSRRGREDDAEYYVYDHQGHRLRKQQRYLAKDLTHVREVRYLAGLEIRTLDDSEHLEVITVQAGRSQVRCLHWVTEPPEHINQNQLRYSLGDHLRSSTLELDDKADVISHEGYLPYGGTAWWSARHEVEARYKTIRYSGKERDASGLYYYDFRYYAPWMMRWICPDPAGPIDGLNLYAMVQNNPMRYRDLNGLMIENHDPELSPTSNADVFWDLNPEQLEKLRASDVVTQADVESKKWIEIYTLGPDPIVFRAPSQDEAFELRELGVPQFHAQLTLRSIPHINLGEPRPGTSRSTTTVRDGFSAEAGTSSEKTKSAKKIDSLPLSTQPYMESKDYTNLSDADKILINKTIDAYREEGMVKSAHQLNKGETSLDIRGLARTTGRGAWRLVLDTIAVKTDKKGNKTPTLYPSETD
ncbi:MAG: RHS repeat-associated core domain-containing protein, partial [Pseudomonadota bacterium]|nr:RHS repeat-associated core domain-containing protein [Pseudomonadota bacterium]